MIRDAATNPRPGDFCAPQLLDSDGATDPHGPNVISPEVGSAVYDAEVARVRAEQEAQA